MKKMAVFLSMILLFQMSMNAESPVNSRSSETGCENGSKINSEWNLDQILEIAGEEADVSIRNAYQEGYRQGLLETAPENEALKVLNEQLKADLKKEKKALKLPFWTLPVSFVSGVATGIILEAVF